MKPVFLGVAAAALLVIAAGGWFVLRGTAEPSPAVSEAGPGTAPQQSRWPGTRRSARRRIKPRRTTAQPECRDRLVHRRCSGGTGCEAGRAWSAERAGSPAARACGRCPDPGELRLRQSRQ